MRPHRGPSRAPQHRWALPLPFPFLALLLAFAALPFAAVCQTALPTVGILAQLAEIGPGG